MTRNLVGGKRLSKRRIGKAPILFSNSIDIPEGCEYTINGIPISGGSGGAALTVMDEGIVLDNAVDTINFIGTDVLAKLEGGVHQINVYIPPPAYVSHYNTSDGTNSSIVSENALRTSTHISTPSGGEGTPFFTGGWADSVHDTTRTSPIQATAAGRCTGFGGNSTVKVDVYNGAGAIVATYTTPAITANGTHTSGGITVYITSYSADSDRFMAQLNVAVTPSAIFADGGRFHFVVTHTTDSASDGSGSYSFTMTDVFFDTNINTPVINNTVSIAENVPAIRYISGVRYYDTGSSFTSAVFDIDDWNYNTQAVADCLHLSAPNFGLPDLSLVPHNPAPSPGFSNRTNDHDDQNARYDINNWLISAANFFYLGNGGVATGTVRDPWNVAPGIASAPAMSIAVDTHHQTSTRLIERFYYEDWRVEVGQPIGYYDTADQHTLAPWDSSTHLLAADACFFNGGCERNTTDFTPYSPDAAGQPDYSGSQNVTTTLVREFQHDGTASSGFTIVIPGNVSSFRYKLAKAWDGTGTGGTVWVSGTLAYSGATWNNGNPSSGGGLTFQSGNSYDCTFGTNNIINCNNSLYVELTFAGADRIAGTMSVVFS